MHPGLIEKDGRACFQWVKLIAIHQAKVEHINCVVIKKEKKAFLILTLSVEGSTSLVDLFDPKERGESGED
ncbi:MAG: hypothetical protein KAX39_07970 [candidate division Zixibacteria bacterium]|nr:hypothetical protein [candidate division Zixibacteria bacterium]